MEYTLLDSGDQKRLEAFGSHRLVRPCSAALWKPTQGGWQDAASFSREENGGWRGNKGLPSSWVISYSGLKFKILLTDFGHVGLFPEHRIIWDWAEKLIQGRSKKPRVLNLFAYSGGATLACARAGAEVCHLDASKGMVDWARENAKLSGLEEAPIRWIVDDVFKFLHREIKRGRFYDGIILDPPSFGRGNRGEVFKIERDLPELLTLCKSLLSDTPLFFALTSHTPGITPLAMEHLMSAIFPGKIESGEMQIPSSCGRALPSGNFARWEVS